MAGLALDLRHFANCEGSFSDLMREAADEIEYLTKTLERARRHLKRYSQPEALTLIEAALER